MAQRAAKIAFTLDSSLLAKVERLRARSGESRSALISRALQLLTAQEEQHERVARYLVALREHPETTQEIESARRSARASVASLAWDDDQ